MKSHTILGSRSQRGLTQLSLDLIYKSLNGQTLDPSSCESLVPSLSATDPSEGQILSASNFIDVVYGDGVQERNNSRAPTPMTVGKCCSHSWGCFFRLLILLARLVTRSRDMDSM